MPSVSKTKAHSKPRAISKHQVPARHAVPLLALIALTVAVYANSLNGDFVFDDQQIVLQNPQLLNIHTLGDVVAVGAGWRQLLFATYGLNYYWSGVSAQGYHIFNLVLHVINVLLVYVIIYELGGRDAQARYLAFAGSAVFSVHTLLSGAVSYIAGRSSVLCGVFYFLAILFFLWATDGSVLSARRWLFLALAGICGLMAWQAKQEAIALPALLAAIVWLRSATTNWKYVVILAVLPLLAAVTMRQQLQSLFTTVMDNKVLVNAGFDTVLQPLMFIRTYITAIVGYYLPRMIVPMGLNADPHILPVEHWYSPEFLVSVMVLGVIVWLGVRFSRKDVLLSSGLAAILISPLTAYTVIPLADVVLEHRAYIPGLGVALLAAALFRRLSVSYPSLRIVAPIVVVAILSIMTIQRNAVFANNVTLWEDAVIKSPQKARARFNLGAAYQNAGRRDDAIREYERALALKPDIHAAYSNMAAIQIDTGQLESGEKTLVRLTEIAPEYTEGFINLSVLYLRKNEIDKSIVASNRAITINPSAFAAFFNRGEALTLQGKLKEAVESYKKAVYLRPDLPSFRLSLGSAYFRSGDKASAEEVFRGLSDGPLAAEAQRSLGSLYSAANEFQKAADHLKIAVMIRPNYTDARHDLGVVYLRQQLIDQAIDEFRATLRIQPDYGPAVLNLSLAHQTKNDTQSARQVLESYLGQFGKVRSAYSEQIQERLNLLRQRGL